MIDCYFKFQKSNKTFSNEDRPNQTGSSSQCFVITAIIIIRINKDGVDLDGAAYNLNHVFFDLPQE